MVLPTHSSFLLIIILSAFNSWQEALSISNLPVVDVGAFLWDKTKGLCDHGLYFRDLGGGKGYFYYGQLIMEKLIGKSLQDLGPSLSSVPKYLVNFFKSIFSL